MKVVIFNNAAPTKSTIGINVNTLHALSFVRVAGQICALPGVMIQVVNAVIGEEYSVVGAMVAGMGNPTAFPYPNLQPNYPNANPQGGTWGGAQPAYGYGAPNNVPWNQNDEKLVFICVQERGVVITVHPITEVTNLINSHDDIDGELIKFMMPSSVSE